MKKHAGESVAIQRCQVHKRRNVLDHLTDEQKPGIAKKLNAAGDSAALQVVNTRHRGLLPRLCELPNDVQLLLRSAASFEAAVARTIFPARTSMRLLVHRQM